MKLTTVAALAASTLVGCASIPDAHIGYYHAKSSVDVQVTRILTCTKASQLIESNSAVVSVAHQAYDGNPEYISLAGLSGTFVDADLTFEHYADGRLKSVNSTVTGQGEAIAKAGLTLGLAAAGKAGDPRGTPVSTSDQEDICDAINGYDKDGNPIRTESLTLVYRAIIEDADSVSKQELNMTPPSKALFDTIDDQVSVSLETVLGPVLVSIEYKPMPDDAVGGGVYKNAKDCTESGNCDDSVMLKIQKTRRMTVTTLAGEDGSMTGEQEVDVSIFSVAAPDKYHLIQIPKPALFGTQGFELALGEAGQIQKIGYDNKTGSSQALGVATEFDKLTSGQTYAVKAAEIRARADLLAQEQRLARCQADASACE